MNKWAYYNDIEPFACEWTRQLINAGVLPDGEVDERSLWDVHSDDVRGFQQCHFCNGIGVWAYALKQAGFPTDRVVWTGSMPCQPFSAAGKRKGVADERHLWPAWFHLIEICRPATIFGEQVASRDGLSWLDLVQADLEGLGYACGPVVTPAAGYGAPHGRHRLYFVADAGQGGHGKGITDIQGRELNDARGGTSRDMADTTIIGGGTGLRDRGPGEQRGFQSANNSILGDTINERLQGRLPGGANEGREDFNGHAGRRGAVNGFWSNAIWLPCWDGKARPTEPGIFPLVNGTPNRVGRLRGYGNAICAPQAIEFVKAFMEIEK